MTGRAKSGSGATHSTLRRRAEATLGVPPSSSEGATSKELFDLAHELHVHQIELEMQNEELRRAQEELQVSRDRYADLYDHAPVGYLTLDGKGRIREANLTAARLLSMERHELVGQGFAGYVSDSQADQSVYFLTRRTTLESGRQQVCELQLQPRDRDRFWARLDSAAARDEDGAPCGLRVIFTDISARKEAERRQDLLTRALDQTADAVVITDTSGSLRYVNTAFERITGYSRSLALGASRHLLDSGRHDAAFYRGVRAALRETGTWLGHVVLKTTDGREYDAEESIAVVRDPAGGTAGFISVHRDTSEELALRRQLQQAQKMEAIGTLAGGIAHDFNNILMGILGYADLGLERYPEGTEPFEYLQPIAKAGQRAAGVVQQILTYSRRAEEQRRAVEVAPIVAEALDLLRATLPSTVEIRRDLRPDCGSVLADPARIHQVVMNLATNAFQAMRESGGILEVSVRSVGAKAPGCGESGCVQLTVNDTGPGLDPELRERIFEPYFTAKQTGEGAGLGLAVVHGIVAGLGGSITVESDPGKGCAFRVRIPRLAEGAEAGDLPATDRLRGTEHLLLVDDEPDLASLGKQLLEARGYRVDAYTDSRAALAAFRAAPAEYDLLVTDQTMPGLTGAGLIEAVLAIRPDLPVVICTGHSDVLDEDGSRVLGAKAFLMKPVRPARMGETVRRVLDDARAQPAP